MLSQLNLSVCDFNLIKKCTLSIYLRLGRTTFRIEGTRIIKFYFTNLIYIHVNHLPIKTTSWKYSAVDNELCCSITYKISLTSFLHALSFKGDTEILLE